MYALSYLHRDVPLFSSVLSGCSSPNHQHLESLDGNVAPSVGVKVSSQAMHGKDHERLRPGSAGHHMPQMAPPGQSSSFPRPIYPVPLLSHVPMVRPPPQLHPNMVQRMLAQGIPPQQLGPALMQAGWWFLFNSFLITTEALLGLRFLNGFCLHSQGMFPPHVDLSQLQGLPPALLGQPLYPLSATGLLPPRANTPMQLAVMQQQLQGQRQSKLNIHHA